MARRVLQLASPVTLQVDGEAVLAERGEPVAVALLAAGRSVFGRSVKYHRPRGAACLRGRCDGCLMRVDGVPNVMTCRLPAREEMVLETQNVMGTARADLLSVTDWFFPEGMDHHHMFTRFAPINRLMQKVARRVAGVGRLPDAIEAPVAARTLERDIVVVGGGRSGVQAANTAAKHGARVLLLEEELSLGGTSKKAGEPLPRPGPPVDVRLGATALAVHDDPTQPDADGRPSRTLLAADEHGLLRIIPRALVVATGSAEGGAVTPGNDRPGVFTARAVLTLLELGVIVGEQVVAIGGGPLLTRAVAWLRSQDSTVVGPIAPARVLGIGGRPTASYVRVKDERGSSKIECDAVLVGGPSTGVYELAGQAGAQVRFDGRGFWVGADDDGRTAHPRTFAIGRCTGRGRGGEGSLEQATAAGIAAATGLDQVPHEAAPTPVRDPVVLPGGKSDKVFVCRCEDVTLHELEQASARGHRDLEAAKRYTGFGTGWCQGKQCVAACARLLAAVGGECASEPITPRPPFHPVRLAYLAGLSDGEEDSDDTDAGHPV